MEFHDAYMVAQAIIDTISDRSESTVEMFAENGIEVARAENFGERGVLTQNAGLVLTLADGTEYQVTIVRSR
jgi:hypothetical protein